MVVGLLGILKADRAYVPLDPAFPKQRLAAMLEDSQVPVLVTSSHLVDGLLTRQTDVVCLDTDWETIARESEENPVSVVRAEHLDLCNLHLWLHRHPQKSRDRTPAASQLPPQHPANTQRAKCEFCHRFYLRRRLGQHGNFSRIMWGWVPAYHLPRQGNRF